MQQLKKFWSLPTKLFISLASFLLKKNKQRVPRKCKRAPCQNICHWLGKEKPGQLEMVIWLVCIMVA